MSNYQLSINNYQLPEGYKQTEVGVIPEDWKVLELGEIAKLERGKFSARPRNDPKFFGGKIPFIQTGDVTQSDGKITSYSQTLNEEGLSVSKLFPKKTLFFTIAANIGDMGIASFATACPDSLIAILPRSYIDKGWIFYALRFRKGEFEDLATQNAQLNINLEKLNPYRLAVPPLSEQRVIAQTLSDVDALIASLDKLIAKQRHLKTATMQQLLTREKRLPEFSNEWMTVQLKEIISDFIVPMRDKPKKLDGEIPWCRIEDFDGKYLSDSKSGQRVSKETIEKMNLKINPINTLLVSCSTNLGKCALVKKPLITNQTFIGLVCEQQKVSEEFLFYYMTFHAQKLNDLSSGTTISYLSREDFEEFSVLIPSQLREQSAIANVLSDMDAAISALETRRAKTQAIKQGMMQELLTGKTRLINNE